MSEYASVHFTVDFCRKIKGFDSPQRFRDFLSVRAETTERRRDNYQARKSLTQAHAHSRGEDQTRHIDDSQYRSSDYGLEL
jgi:hypothetical protein